VFSATVPAAHVGSAYAFVLDTPSGTYSRLDPYCRQLSSTTRCLVLDPSAFAWSDASWKRPAREGTVVYELHVGSFAVDAGAALGSFASAQARLPELADLGVTTLELMPAMDFGGRNGWGYNPQLYQAPQPAFGTADELRAFVDAAHAQGLAVWLDVVVNHMDGWRQAPLACFDDGCPDGGWGPYFFEAGPYATTPWGPRPDYTEPHVAQMLLDSARAWLGEFHGDGFRWDSVSNIRALDGVGTTPGGRELLVAANELTHQAGALSVAEDLKGFADITTPPSTGGFGFDAQWDGFGYDVMNQLSLTQDDARDLGVVQNALQGGYAGDGFARLLFVEDHDTVGNGGARLPVRIDAASPESFAARRRAMLGAVLLLTSPGVPMLFMGQESLATQGFASPPLPLQAPTVHGLEVRAFYKDLIALRRNRAGTTASLGESEVDVLHRNDANKVLAWRRHGPSGQDVIVLMNLKNKAYTGYDIGVPAAGNWQVRLDTDWLAYGADFSGGQQGALTAVAQSYDGQPAKLTVKLGAYGAVVLSR
jgi:1,4-alpha-glucan branching enzyme